MAHPARYAQCPVPGCVTRGNARYLAAHRRQLHKRCICGWVGVGFTQHAAQRRRYGDRLAHSIMYELRSEVPADG